MKLLTFSTRRQALAHVARAWPGCVKINRGNNNILWQRERRYVAEMWVAHGQDKWMVLCEQKEAG